MFFSPSYKKVGTAIKIKYRYCSDNDIENDTDTDTDNDIENDSTKMLQKYFFYSSETFQQVGGAIKIKLEKHLFPLLCSVNPELSQSF